MPRRASVKHADEIEDFNSNDGLFKPSLSLSSDDGMAMLAAKMKASWEKKKQDKESKLLQGAQREMDHNIQKSIQEFSVATQDIDAAFAKFRIDYNAVEEEIHSIWKQILREHQRLLNVSEQLHALESECEKGRDSKQLKGLIAIKKGCNETARLVQRMKEIECSDTDDQ